MSSDRTLSAQQKLPATIAIGDRKFDVRAFFRRCHEGKLHFLGLGITRDQRDLTLGFSPPLPAYDGIPRKANPCELDFARFRAEQCPSDRRCASWAGVNELHACSNQMSIQLSTRTEPPNAAERARGVTNVVFTEQLAVTGYTADPITGDFSNMTLARRIIRSETNPSLHDVPVDTGSR